MNSNIFWHLRFGAFAKVLDEFCGLQRFGGLVNGTLCNDVLAFKTSTLPVKGASGRATVHICSDILAFKTSTPPFKGAPGRGTGMIQLQRRFGLQSDDSTCKRCTGRGTGTIQLQRRFGALQSDDSTCKRCAWQGDRDDLAVTTFWRLKRRLRL